MQIVDVRHRLVSKRNDDVAIPYVGTCRWATRFKRDDEHPAFHRELVKTDQSADKRHVLPGDAKVTRLTRPSFSSAGMTILAVLMGIAKLKP